MALPTIISNPLGIQTNSFRGFLREPIHSAPVQQLKVSLTPCIGPILLQANSKSTVLEPSALLLSTQFNPFSFTVSVGRKLRHCQSLYCTQGMRAVWWCLAAPHCETTPAILRTIPAVLHTQQCNWTIQPQKTIRGAVLGVQFQ